TSDDDGRDDYFRCVTEWPVRFCSRLYFSRSTHQRCQALSCSFVSNNDRSVVSPSHLFFQLACALVGFRRHNFRFPFQICVTHSGFLGCTNKTGYRLRESRSDRRSHGAHAAVLTPLSTSPPPAGRLEIRRVFHNICPIRREFPLVIAGASRHSVCLAAGRE
ncbi:hypothetical protein EDB85DRAFT_1991839, partial [Lactarius pseudohatsudake]